MGKAEHKKTPIRTRTYTKTILYSCAFVLFFVSFSVLPSVARAAYFYFSPAEGSFRRNENFKVGILVNTDSVVNAVQGIVNFPSEFLEVIDIERNNGNSIIDFWVQKPSFSNTGDSGNVHFEGVILNPGFVGSAGKIMDVVFRVKKEGAADLDFTDFAILANDGKGTNVSAANGKATFVFSLASALPGGEGTESVPREDLRQIRDKIKSVEEKIIEISQKPPIVIGPTEAPTGILAVWSVLPEWVRISTIVLIGIAAIILSLLILSFGIVLLVWLWSYASHRKRKFLRWLGLVPGGMRDIALRTATAVESAEKEIEGDIKYGLRQLKHDIREAEKEESLGKITGDYWKSIVKISKRFFRKNIKNNIDSLQ